MKIIITMVCVLVALLVIVVAAALYHIKKMPGNAAPYHLENVESLAESPLQGKRILFLGSSVTYGVQSLQTSMADYIEKLDGCTVVKEALSGTTLSTAKSNSYVKRLLKVDTAQTFDAVVVQLSTNDATQGLTLGTVGDSKDMESFDTETILGAMEYIIAYCEDTWHCPVLIYTGTKYDSEAYAAMVAAMPQLQEKWGVDIIDLWNDAEMNAVSDKDYALYMGDSIHPTQAGYLQWWTPKFEEHLYKLFA